MDQSLIDFAGASTLSMNMERMNMQEDQNRAVNAQHALTAQHNGGRPS